MLFRMGWPELQGHPFWTQLVNEEEDVDEGEEEDEEEGDKENDNCCEGVGAPSLR